VSALRLATRDRARPLLLGFLGIALVMAAWEIAVRAFQVPHYILPPMSGIVAMTIAEWPTLLAAAWVTVLEVVFGLGIGMVIGVALAIVMVIVPRAKPLIMPPLIAINAVPSVAYAPLAQLWFGMGPEGKVFMVAFVVSYTVLLNTLDGLERVDNAAINLLKSFGAGRMAILWRLRFPSAAAAAATGVRISVVRGMIIAVVTEMLGAYRGLGWIVFQSVQQIDYLRVWAAVLVTSITSLALFAIVSMAERKLIYWR
jgi:NitT/TauT family transport system permease protein